MYISRLKFLVSPENTFIHLSQVFPKVIRPWNLFLTKHLLIALETIRTLGKILPIMSIFEDLYPMRVY